MEQEKINCRVFTIYPDADTIGEALGFTKERELELLEQLAASLDVGLEQSAFQISSIMEEVSMVCRHPNELAFLMWFVGYLQKTRDVSALGWTTARTTLTDYLLRMRS